MCIFFFIYFFNFFFLTYNIVLVLPYIDMNPPWVYLCSSSQIPLPPLSPSYPSGSFIMCIFKTADFRNLDCRIFDLENISIRGILEI